MKLSNDEIDEANARLVERHPLYYSGMTIRDIFPFLWGFKRKRDGDNSRDDKIDSFLSSEDERSDGYRQSK